MAALTGPALVAASLLALAGAQKLLDPTMTVGALRALRLPSSPMLVRAGSAVELALGVAAITVGGAALWWAVAASYVLFGAFVALALLVVGLLYAAFVELPRVLALTSRRGAAATR